MKNEFKIVSVLVLVVLVLMTGCKQKKEETIVFDDSYPLALSPNIEWAVVEDPYAAYRSECNWDSSVTGHCRKGDILQIKGKSIDAKKDNWYLFANGWLPENCLSIYSNRLKAKAVSEKLIGSEK